MPIKSSSLWLNKIFTASLFFALLVVILCLSGVHSAFAQSYDFPTTVTTANPSLYLNFNDTTTAFKDQVSGQNFVGTEITDTQTYNTLPGSYSTALTGGLAYFYFAGASGQLPSGDRSGMLISFSVYFITAPSAGQILYLFNVTNCGGACNYAPVHVISVTLAATSGLQTFTAPTDFTAFPMNQYDGLGIYTTGTSPAVGVAASGAGVAGMAKCYSGVPTSGNPLPSCGNQSYGMALTAQIVSSISGTVTPLQSGFNSTLVNNYSASFPYNGFNAAPNNTLGAIDWSSPWSMMAQVDRLNWNRSGQLVLASKGDVAGGTGTFWELYLKMSGSNSQLCFTRSGTTTVPFATRVGNTRCTNPSLDAMPNGSNYNIVVTDSGTGASGDITYGGGLSALDIYINGFDKAMNLAESSQSSSSALGFGAVQVSVSSGGTGYANSTSFTSSGGGPNCVVSGTMPATGGVINTSWQSQQQVPPLSSTPLRRPGTPSPLPS